jgi:hypothetical protein
MDEKMRILPWKEGRIMLHKNAKTLGMYRWSFNRLVAKAKNLPIPPQKRLRKGLKNGKFTENYSEEVDVDDFYSNYNNKNIVGLQILPDRVIQHFPSRK